MPVRVDAQNLMPVSLLPQLEAFKIQPPDAVHSLRGLADEEQAERAEPEHVLERLSLGAERTVRDTVLVGEEAAGARLHRSARSLDSALRNTNEGVSISGLAQEGLSRIKGKLDELRLLATQASVSTIIGPDRTALNEKFAALRADIDQIVEQTVYNGKTLLDGSLAESAPPPKGPAQQQPIEQQPVEHQTVGPAKPKGKQLGGAVEDIKKAEEGARKEGPVGGKEVVPTGGRSPSKPSSAPLLIAVGINAGETFKLGFESATSRSLGLSSANLNSAANAESAVTTLDAALNTASQQQAASERDLGSLSEIATRVLTGRDEANARRLSLDEVEQAATTARQLANREAATALVVQANTDSSSVLRLLD